MTSDEPDRADQPTVDYSREFTRTFRARVPGETAAERFDAMVDLVGHTLEAFDGLLRPTRVSYHIIERGEDCQVDSESTDEITPTQFERAVRSACPSGECQLVTTNISGPTQLRLANEDHWIDTGSPQYTDPLREDELPSKSPITVGLSQNGAFVAGYQHVIDIRVHTDVFTRKSPAGQVNRQRLGTALEHLYTGLDVFDIRLEADVHTESGFKCKGFDELLFED
jgi:hypothetical protein